MDQSFLITVILLICGGIALAKIMSGLATPTENVEPKNELTEKTSANNQRRQKPATPPSSNSPSSSSLNPKTLTRPPSNTTDLNPTAKFRSNMSVLDYKELSLYEEVLGLHLNPLDDEIEFAYKRKIIEINNRSTQSYSERENWHLAITVARQNLIDESVAERSARYYQLATFALEEQKLDLFSKFIEAMCKVNK